MRTSQHPGLDRTLTLSNASADYCDVHVAEEQITLRFERQLNGIIQCTGHMIDMPDVPNRSSRHAFDLARKAAVKQMNTLRGKEVVRSIHEEPLVTFSNMHECSMSYGGNLYSYTCAIDKPLMWKNLQLAAVFAGKGASVYLLPEEELKLKQRAFGKIKNHRRHVYADDGEGEFVATPQLSLAL